MNIETGMVQGEEIKHFAGEIHHNSTRLLSLINDIIQNTETYVISLKGPFDYHKYNNLQNYMCLYEYTPNSIKTVVKYLKGELDPKGVLPIKL